jgi:hypothetical protein
VLPQSCRTVFDKAADLAAPCIFEVSLVPETGRWAPRARQPLVVPSSRCFLGERGQFAGVGLCPTFRGLVWVSSDSDTVQFYTDKTEKVAAL